MCAIPVDATAAPFRALQRGERFASRRTSDTPKSRNAGPHPQGADVACGAAGPIAVAGGKDCLRSAAPLVGQLPQAPTANSEALPFPLLLNRQEADAVQCRQWEWPSLITILRPSLVPLPFIANGRAFG